MRPLTSFVLGGGRTLTRMQILPLVQRLLPCFLMSRVGNASIHRANFNTFRRFKPTDTFSAFGRVNNINVLPLSYGLIFAFWLAGTTTNALLSDLVCRLLLEKKKKQAIHRS